MQRSISILHVMWCLFEKPRVMRDNVVHCLILCLGIKHGFVRIVNVWTGRENRNNMWVIIQLAQYIHRMMHLNHFIWFGSFVDYNNREKLRHISPQLFQWFIFSPACGIWDQYAFALFTGPCAAWWLVPFFGFEMHVKYFIIHIYIYLYCYLQ